MAHVIEIPTRRATVVSFYAPRYVQWSGVNYDDCLAILDASCKRLGVEHICISDSERPGIKTFLTDLPDNLMQAFLVGQIAWLKHANGAPTMFTGADCIITRDPTYVCVGYDMAITTRHYTSLNTGALWCYSKTCIQAFENALALNPIAWGEDQTCLLAGIRKTPGLRLRELPFKGFNAKVTSADDNLDNPPIVVHLKGNATKKALMAPWYANFCARHDKAVRSAA